MSATELEAQASAAWAIPEQAAGILHGLRVLDLSRVLAGPYCAQMLSDHGASVIKVEGPAGDETRGWGPPFHPDGTSAYYHGLNRNKRNLGLDLSTEAGRAVLSRLIAEADVVVENFKTGTMARWGLGYEEVLSERHPHLVYCRISGFGADGPMGRLPGYDAVLQAYGGLMSVNGHPDREPLRVGVPIVDLMAANLAFSGILLALHERRDSGRGQLVDIALLDAVVSILHPHSASWIADGRVPRRTGGAHPVVAPYQVFTTRSGDFFISAANDRQFAALMRVLGRPEVAEDPRFADNAARITHLDELAPLLAELIGARDGGELAGELIAAGVPASPVNDVGTALREPQVAHRGLFVDTDEYRGVGVPISFGRSPTRRPTAPVARGADTASILAGLGYDESEITRLGSEGAFRSS
ncbi:Crotonobetainyl-CoA:carnitine CoA-transferase CaiB [Thermomonospora echinospora]|uniref:Crotonobetainyl-CoA:carnitine CoA-transferase CaiB n=1 Tax=Thermomonospora echinospora TaxID=1992 RepID=A0A1H6E9P2_9ACTN|nr:CoA transferase [Thermomonospora echinospora]SEG93963.1 Crotonobetainyl-CoA:carnitine CoA-transferase CaiB [Thermomonospora echinospora]